jgi:hypothetical protein
MCLPYEFNERNDAWVALRRRDCRPKGIHRSSRSVLPAPRLRQPSPISATSRRPLRSIDGMAFDLKRNVTKSK